MTTGLIGERRHRVLVMLRYARILLDAVADDLPILAAAEIATMQRITTELDTLLAAAGQVVTP